MLFRAIFIAFLAFFFLGETRAEDTNQTGTSGMRPLAPMKPLTPTMKPLGPPPAPAAPSTPSAPAAPPATTTKGAPVETGASASAPKGSAPFKMSMTKGQVPQQYVDAKGQRITLGYLRLNFKITEPGITSLDTAVVYLFNQKKELVGSLTDMNPQVKLSGVNASESVLNYPNMLTVLTGLDKNKSYNLIFMYTINEVQFKYAVGVIGTKAVVVAEAYPGSAHAEDFTFDGKDKLAK